ncbi:hypothetical protein A0H76_369 [Hepatospora eriocheir]|uniref:Uncharacterized protein n=1 Tax=Hepatospora eriocheir TaxID=1081669 RepID=A0A1X0QBH2_9MICR|nr:hypothetical protein A0H76_1471 [Hepatospora eriocheir]ORD97139.1 hypothetical protein A0H76_369 [Hepatospora eriocheir]
MLITKVSNLTINNFLVSLIQIKLFGVDSLTLVISLMYINKGSFNETEKTKAIIYVFQNKIL